MAKRGKVGQTKHDNKVEQQLDYWKKKNYRVWADLPGRAKPPKIRGRIPDIYARKGKKLFVEEIETSSTKYTDKEQHRRLREGTKKLGGKFRVKIAK